MSAAEPTLRIQPTSGWVSLRLGELWRYRELLYFLTWRDIKVRYRQTLLGVAWAIIVPLVSTVLFTFVFGRVANLDPEGYPYPVFLLAALLPWNFFASALAQCANAVAQSGHLMSKVYFPRLIAPLAAVLAGLPDFLIAFALYVIAMIIYGVMPSAAIVFLPVFILFTVAAALGIGLWLAGLSAKYRDVKHAVPFMIQAWLLITPVVYSSNAVTEKWRTLYGLNPMAGVVECFRWALLGLPPHWDTVALSALVTVFLLITGAFFFRRVERTFADLL